MDYNNSPLSGNNSIIMKAGSIVVIIAAIGFFFFQQSRLKSMSYTGRVVDKYVSYKKYTTGKNFFKRRGRKYILVIHTGEGKKIKYPVSYSIYTRIALGDSVVKEKGELYPEKVITEADSIYREYRHKY